MTFDDVGRQVINLYGEGRFEQALGLIEAAYPDHPDQDRTLTFWKACLLGVAGRPLDAQGVLEAGMARGLWWAPDTLADSDLDPVRELPGWDAVLGRCREATERFVAGHRPEAVVHPARAEPVAGTVVTLHGAGTAPAAFGNGWRAATPPDWAVVAPVGPVPFTETEWAWPADHAVGAAAAQAQLVGLAFPSPVVLAGFSQGSAVAAQLAWQGSLDAAGLLLVAVSIRRPSWDPASHRPVPTYLAVGEHDWALPGCRDLADQLRQHGVPAHLEELPGIGHQTPADLDAVVTRALAWIAEAG